MYRITFNVYCLYRADELTAAASYAHFGRGLGNGQTTLKRNHVDGLYGAVLGAGSATGTVYVYNADILVEYHTSGLGFVFLLNRERLYGAGRADLAAQVAVKVAVAVIKLHDRLHDTAQSVLHTCGLENMAGALAHAKMA